MRSLVQEYSPAREAGFRVGDKCFAEIGGNQRIGEIVGLYYSNAKVRVGRDVFDVPYDSLQKADVFESDGFSVSPIGVQDGLLLIDISGHTYGYAPTDLPLDVLQRKFMGILRFSAGRALRWLKKHSKLALGGKVESSHNNRELAICLIERGA